MIDRCPYCHTPLESHECSLCSTLHQIGLCVRHEKDFLEYRIWPELQRWFYQRFPSEVVVELQDEDEAMPLGRELGETCPLEARVGLMARMWRDYQSVVRRHRRIITRHHPFVVFWAWMPLVAAERARLAPDAPWQMVYNWMFFSGLRALVDSVRQGKRDDEIFKSAITAMQDALEGLPIVHGAWMAMTNDPVECEILLMSLSGLISTGISLKQTMNPRLYNMLCNDVAADPALPSLSAALYRKLPGSVLLAWQCPPFNTQAFIRRIHRSLVSDGPVESSKNNRRFVPPENFSLEDMWIYEEAYRTVERVISELPPREAAIWNLACQGVPYAEIARCAGIAEGTVKSTVSSVKGKIHKNISA